jgi:Ca-activated chloride channel family protein
MEFLWPVMLYSLLLVPFLAVLYWAVQRRRQKLVARYGSLGLLQSAVRPGLRRHIPPALFLLGLTVLLVSLARPQTVVQVPRVQGTVLLAFDVSGSMAADDAEITRMDAAKAAAKAFVEKQPADVLIGVIAFSDSGFAIQSPTNVREPVLATIERMKPQRGTSLGHGIMAALTVLEQEGGEGALVYSDRTPEPTPSPTPVPPGTITPAVIVLLSDGENNGPPDPLQAAQTAADRGVRIYTVGLGSAEGAVLNIDGFRVRSRLDESMLSQIAAISGGTYFKVEDTAALTAVYEDLIPQLQIKAEEMEITALLAGASLLILLLGGSLSLLWFSRFP